MALRGVQGLARNSITTWVRWVWMETEQVIMVVEEVSHSTRCKTWNPTSCQLAVISLSLGHPTEMESQEVLVEIVIWMTVKETWAEVTSRTIAKWTTTWASTNSISSSLTIMATAVLVSSNSSSPRTTRNSPLKVVQSTTAKGLLLGPMDLTETRISSPR